MSDRKPPEPSGSHSAFLQTVAVQPELDIAPGFASFSPPTHRGSTVVFRNLAELRAHGDGATTYWRYGLHATPTSEALCQHLALIEGARHTLLLPSGLAAISQVYFALVKSGDDVLVPDNVYGPNREHGEWLARDYGVSVRYYDPMIGAGIAGLIRPNTKLIWMESPGSVTMEIPDTQAIVAGPRARGGRFMQLHQLAVAQMIREAADMLPCTPGLLRASQQSLACGAARRAAFRVNVDRAAQRRNWLRSRPRSWPPGAGKTAGRTAGIHL